MVDVVRWKLARNPRELVKYWNMMVAQWLKYRTSSNPLSHILTLSQHTQTLFLFFSLSLSLSLSLPFSLFLFLSFSFSLFFFSSFFFSEVMKDEFTIELDIHERLMHVRVGQRRLGLRLTRLITFVISAFWHGFYPGYYFFFIGSVYFIEIGNCTSSPHFSHLFQ
jgi:hypothetical protein